MSQQNKNLNNQDGIIAIVTLLAVSAVALAIISSISSLAVNSIKTANSGGIVDKTFYAAESGLHEGLYRVKTNPAPTPVGSPYIVTIDGIVVQVTVADDPNNAYQRIIKSTANDANGNIRVATISVGTNSFAGGINQAVQSGTGGVYFSNGTVVNGDIYSNGDIVPINNGNVGTLNGNATSTGSIKNMTINGSAHFASATSSDIYEDAFYQTIANTTKVGPTGGATHIVCPNASGYCHQKSTGPASLSSIFTTASINQQISLITNVVSNACSPSGSFCVTQATNLGPNRINGDLNISNNQTLTLTGDIYVTGQVNFGNNCKIALAKSLTDVGASAFIITDSKVDYGNNCQVVAPANINSFVFLVSNYTTTVLDPSSPSYDPAIKLSNNADSMVFVTINGALDIKNGAALNAGVNKLISLGNVTVTFKPSLSSFYFGNPTSNQTLVPQPATWQEL